MRRMGLLMGLGLILFGLFQIFPPRKREVESGDRSGGKAREEIAPTDPIPPAGPRKLPVVTGTGADLLGKGVPGDDLLIVERMLASVLLLVKDFRELPIANNADFVRILTGGNSAGVRWLSPDHPAINGEGEIIDQWGSPIQFHRESWSHTTLRSAGPDRVLYTEDDLVLASPE